MSFRLWDTIRPCSSPVLEKFKHNVFTASGETIEIKGKTTVFIDICGIHCACSVVVANIDVDLILGLDFFKTHQCQIDVTRNSLTVQGKSCELTCSG